MAYANTPTLSAAKTISGRRHWTGTVTETETAAASEWGPLGADDLPARFTLVKIKAQKTAGSATTIAPVIANATPATASTIAEEAAYTAAAFISDTTRVHVDNTAGSGLYGTTTPDAGTDNSVTTKIYIVEGWI